MAIVLKVFHSFKQGRGLAVWLSGRVLTYQ